MCHIGSTMNMLVTVPRVFRLENKQHFPGHDSPQPASPFGSHELLFSKNGTPQRLRRQSIFIDFETDPSLYSGSFFIFYFFKWWASVFKLNAGCVAHSALRAIRLRVALCAHAFASSDFHYAQDSAHMPPGRATLSDWSGAQQEPVWLTALRAAVKLELSQPFSPHTSPRMGKACDYSKDHVRTRVLWAS